jgi:transposase
MMDGTMSEPGLGRGRRMARQRKRETVLRLLGGEDLELVSRSLGVTASTLPAYLSCMPALVERSWLSFHLS